MLRPHRMAKTGFKRVDEYFAAQPKEVQAVLRRVRAAVRKALPDAEETISYQIPTYKLHGRAVLSFAGWKGHFSIYPASDRLIDALPELAPYKVSRSTLRFPLSGPVPLRLIGRFAKLRAWEAAERAAAKRAAKRRR